MLIGKVVAIAYLINTPLGNKIGYSNLKVGILIGYLVYSNCSTCDIDFVWVVSIAYFSFLLEINGSGPLVLK
jgi:hypothetical protein